ncbi:polysaccharide deacetylase family sporulation protein PdaB [Paenibacillus sp. DS2015]|uniref:polysaccharide deacetylase family protein n=1 Tax=Paenibacillus sp. DS2015 TaxID=3373917 RepID=UPI003D1A2E77
MLKRLLICIVLLFSMCEVTFALSILPNSSPPLSPEQPDTSVPANSAGVKPSARDKQISSLAQLYHKYPETIKTRGERIKQIALTFDDAPDSRFTAQVLDVLDKHHVKATFFVIGERAKKHPELVARMNREGHSIGNHSYNHPQFSKISFDSFQDQILKTEQIIHQIVGYSPRLIRPPYGDITESQLKWAKAHGYKIINWNVDSLDWKGLSKEEVKKNILSSVGPGSIILQHAGGGEGSDLKGSIEALPEVIQELRDKGYTFVLVADMLHISMSKEKTTSPSLKRE